jgi:RNA polymerase sigma-70 factor (ECF subfamily)
MTASVRPRDADAFGAIYHAYYAPLCSLARRYVRADEAAEELVQEVLLRVWEQRSWSHLQDGALRSYLYTAVRNQALDALKRERVARRWHERVLREPDALVGPRPDGADDNAAVEELAAVVERLVAALPPRCRQAYLLRREQQLGYEEIARIMGVATKTVEVQIGLALRALRRGLADWVPSARGGRVAVRSAGVERREGAIGRPLET